MNLIERKFKAQMEPIIPCVDIAFKKIFGVDENKDLLISLINSIVGPDDQVADVTILNPYNAKNFGNEKLSILDIKAQGIDGKRFNVEIQISDEGNYDKRALYYWGKIYTEQLKTGDSYGVLKKSIGIHILNFISIPDSTKYHNVFQLREKEDGFQYFDDLELHTVELKKFSGAGSEKLEDLMSKIQSSLDIWASFLTRHHLIDKENLTGALDYQPLHKALNVLDVMNFGIEEREEYEAHLKWIRIEADTLENYEKKGFEKGVEKGREEGIQEGIEKGIEKGRRDQALAIAKNLVGKIAIEEICLITGLDPSDIENF